VAKLLSVNLGTLRPSAAADVGATGIDKRPTDARVEVRAPGPKRGGLGSGLVGDGIADLRSHGGDDQAVYAYAREDLDRWQEELGRPLAGGAFGENLTTLGVDVTGALVGERWRIGDTVLLQVTLPRIPCRTFAHRMAEPGWIKTFTARALPGTYLRVVEGGTIRVGDPVRVVDRPDHEVTVGLTFRALTLEPALLPLLLTADDMPDDIKRSTARRAAPLTSSTMAEPSSLDT
jgi:MOSC domain-containing protein YiiM